MRTTAAMAAAVAATLWTGTAGTAPLRPAARAVGLCAVGETTVFSCTAGAKVVSVCAHGGFAQYRFGTPRHVELAYPARAGAGSLTFARAAYSGGGEAQIGFAQGPHRYVVYSRVVRTSFGADGNRPAFEAGVLVLANGHRLADRRCTRPADAAIDSAAAERLLPAGEIAYPDE